MKKKVEELPKTVVEIGEINWHDLDVNLIPNSWYQYIKKSKKPNRLAIEILAEIVYWYRPSPVRDEITMKTIGYRKKFKSDAWQVSYAKLEAKFGATRRETKAAVDLLVSLKLVGRTFRNFVTDEGMHLSNVMYLEPVAKNVRGITLERRGSYTRSEEGIRSNDTPSSVAGEDVYRDSYKDSTENKKREEEEKIPPSSSDGFASTDKNLAESVRTYLGFQKLKKLTKADNEAIDQNPSKFKDVSQFGFERAWSAWDRYDSLQSASNYTYRSASTRTFATFVKWGRGRLFDFVMDQFIIEVEAKNVPEWDKYIHWNADDGFRGIEIKFGDWLVKKRPELQDAIESFYLSFSWSQRFAYLKEFLEEK